MISLALNEADVARIAAYWFQHVTSAAAASSVLLPAVPKGVTRVYVTADVSHNDDVATPIIWFALVDPQGNNVKLPSHSPNETINLNCNKILDKPVIVPEGFQLGAFFSTGITGAHVAGIDAFYFDLIR